MRKAYFTIGEIALFAGSELAILVTYWLWGDGELLSLIASLIGVASLILNAKGNPGGQALMLVFSVLYGIISYTFSYYGEMITYLGMTAPMAAAALIAWLRNPYKGNKAQVAVNRISRRESALMLLASLPVTMVFYVILKAFHTTNLLPSTLSVTTSFIAAYLTFRRSPYFALAYAANDLVLIVLWTLAALANSTYVTVIVCFMVFFINDLYGFYSWQRMQQRQEES